MHMSPYIYIYKRERERQRCQYKANRRHRMEYLRNTAAAAKSLQSCPTLCDPIESSPPSAIPGMLQARTLEWVAISSSNAWSRSSVSPYSCVRLFSIPRTVAHQAPLSMGFSRPRILEWVAIPFSRGSFQPRDQT